MKMTTPFPTEEQHERAWEELAREIWLHKDTVQQVQAHNPGELTIIGSGIQSLGFIRGEEKLIQRADAVFYCVADPATAVWIRALRPDAYDLCVLYGNQKLRYATYIQMTESMLHFVRLGKKVVAIFYGHPGIFSLPPHRAILLAKREGHKATMKPGVSALDYLCADLGVDPAYPGMQIHEATNVLICQRHLEVSLHVVLWQVGLIGEIEFRDQGFINQNFSELVKYLEKLYGEKYPITHYVASRYATIAPVIETYALDELYDPRVQSKITSASTFYLAPKKSTITDCKQVANPGIPPKLQTPNRLREIGHYGREMAAFENFKKFRIPNHYYYQQDTAASRFLIALQEDFHLQQQFAKNPSVALKRFPHLTRVERNLLATKDPNNIQAAAKGLARRSSANERLLWDLCTTQDLSQSLLQSVKKMSPRENARDLLLAWTQENGYQPEWKLLHTSLSRASCEWLLLWDGIYLAKEENYLITIQGSPSQLDRGRLHVNGKFIAKFSFQCGILQWTAQKGVDFCGFFRRDVQLGKSRLVGSIWKQNPSTSPAFFAQAIDPEEYSLNQLIGSYIQHVDEKVNQLRISPPHPENKKRQLTVLLNGKELLEIPSYQPHPPTLSVGKRTFPLTSPQAERSPHWVSAKKLSNWFYGTYTANMYLTREKKNRKQFREITVVPNRIELARETLLVIEENHKSIKWTDGSKNFPKGSLSFFLDPITLLPCLIGAFIDGSGKEIRCYGMIPDHPNSLASASEPLFNIPKHIWEILLEQCKKDSYQGGPCLWESWNRVHTTTPAIHKLMDYKHMPEQ